MELRVTVSMLLENIVFVLGAVANNALSASTFYLAESDKKCDVHKHIVPSLVGVKKVPKWKEISLRED